MFSNPAQSDKFKKIIGLFSSIGIINIDGWGALSDNLNQLSPDERRLLFDTLSVKCQLDDSIKHIKEYFKNNPEILSSLEKLILEKDPKVFFIVSMILPFTYGFGFLGYESGLLTCAQVAARKRDPDKVNAYIFNPTILNTKDDLKKYLQALKDKGSTQDIRERFVFAGAHWLTFDIQIVNGDINILILESFGQDKKHFSTIEILEIVSGIFSNASLLFSKNQRQHTEMGCSVFSLDDSMHLFTLENYLQEKNLFKYLLLQNQKPEMLSQFSTVKIIPVELPLSLMRTKQHIDLKNVVIPARIKENALPVNKKNQTALESVKSSFKPRSDNPAKELNLRLDEKLYDMACNNLIYLLNHSIEDVIQATAVHTLKGFEERTLKSNQITQRNANPSQQKP